MNWKPIETAPKDSTLILTWDGRHQNISYWGRENAMYRAGWIGGHCRVNHIDQPTHWMPLPDPPKPDLSDKGDPRFQMFRAGKEARDDGLTLDHAPDVMEGEHRQIWINGWVGRDTELRGKS